MIIPPEPPLPPPRWPSIPAASPPGTSPGRLFVRQRRPRKVKLGALLHGGGHERGLRSGTLNVPGIVGIGYAAELCLQSMAKVAARIGALHDELETQLLTISGKDARPAPRTPTGLGIVALGLAGADR